MLHAGLDLSRRRLDVCLVDDAGEVVAQMAAAPDADGLRHLAMRVQGGRVRAVIESMNGARSVHDTLEELGWEVLVADAQKVKGLAPLARETDKWAWTAAHPGAMKCSTRRAGRGRRVDSGGS
jgi:transposase